MRTRTSYVRVPILLRRTFFRDFLEWARRDGAVPALLGGQVLEVELAARRLKHISAVSVSKSAVSRVPGRREKHGKEKLDAATVQKILFLRGEMSIADLAVRFDVGETTIRRILECHSSTDHVAVPVIGRSRPRPEQRLSI